MLMGQNEPKIIRFLGWKILTIYVRMRVRTGAPTDERAKTVGKIRYAFISGPQPKLRASP